MATTAGNLLQRTRCMYFRDTAMPCNKREPGTGCPAITGSNRTLAILGTSENCIATNPSDMNVAMTAAGGDGARAGSEGLTRRPDRRLSSPARPHPSTRDSARTGRPDNARHAPTAIAGSKQVYLKLRDRASYEFALASAAVVITVAADGDVGARCAGWRGTKPGGLPSRGRARRPDGNATHFRNAAEAALRDAKPQSENAFKIELAKRCLTHALQTAAMS